MCEPILIQPTNLNNLQVIGKVSMPQALFEKWQPKREMINIELYGWYIELNIIKNILQIENFIALTN